MKQKSTHRIYGLFFLAILLTPVSIAMLHVFEDHHHEVCTDTSTHIHAQNIDCDICDFHFTPFTFNSLLPSEILIGQIPFLKNTHYTPSHHTTIGRVISLRGPPTAV